ncbi:hypothetical protein ACJMK2_036822 [Sinanodonta woodiana]|uniref:Uncharacterized protein n=1 Tax=Sinanodonta woodiana TaxID=1069815 RepID=A0ABD3WLY6_SINWO
MERITAVIGFYSTGVRWKGLQLLLDSTALVSDRNNYSCYWILQHWCQVEKVAVVTGFYSTGVRWKGLQLLLDSTALVPDRKDYSCYLDSTALVSD